MPSDITARFLQTLNERGATDVEEYLGALGALGVEEVEAGRITVSVDPPVHRLVGATAAGLLVLNLRYHDAQRTGWDIEAVVHDWRSVQGLTVTYFARVEHGTAFPTWSLSLQRPALDIRGHADADTRALAAAIVRHLAADARRETP